MNKILDIIGLLLWLLETSADERLQFFAQDMPSEFVHF